MFHPSQRTWAMAGSWTSCAEFGDEPCKIYKELYVTKDLGQEWTYLTNYVFDFEWGASKIAKSSGIDIPDERVFVTRDADGQGHQKNSKKSTWSTKIDLFVSDDFFKTSKLLVEAGNTIVKTQ
jgi:Sortilin, neurotensin receptor 3,